MVSDRVPSPTLHQRFQGKPNMLFYLRQGYIIAWTLLSISLSSLKRNDVQNGELACDGQLLSRCTLFPAFTLIRSPPVIMPPPLDPEAQGTELADLDLGPSHLPPRYDNAIRPPDYDDALNAGLSAGFDAGVDAGVNSSTPPPAYSLETAFGGTTLATWILRNLEKMPESLKRWFQMSAEWCRGPQPPELNVIKPLIEDPYYSIIPVHLIRPLPNYIRLGCFFVALGVWAAAFGAVITVTAKASASDYVDGTLYRLTCTNRLWKSPVECGLDGIACRPFDNRSMSFTCPAGCASTILLDPYTVGDQQIKYKPLVIGGTPVENPWWRGDSFICAAAIQAGVISNQYGGCGVLNIVGQRDSYGSIERNGIPSVDFNSTFPMSFEFDHERPSRGICQDPRWNLLGLSIFFTVLFGLFTSSPGWFFVPVFIITFFQVAMASDPPGFYDYARLTSTAMGRALPAGFIAAFIYRWSVRRTLLNLKAPVEKTVLWVGGLWVGALCNLTLSKIPIRRLHGADIRKQAGGLVALIIIILILVAIVLYQAWCFRKEGRLLRYLKLYSIITIGLLVLYAIPHENLRLHHYILALLLLPGTSIQTRPSLIYQGLLLGLFINGIARWDFAPILETSTALSSRASIDNTLTFHSAHPNMGLYFSFDNYGGANHMHIVTQAIPPGFDGLSILVNDVERFRGFVDPELKGVMLPLDNRTDVNLTAGVPAFHWWRDNASVPVGKAEFVRIGLVRYSGFGKPLGYGSFTRAGIWWDDGRWVLPEEGETSGYVD